MRIGAAWRAVRDRFAAGGIETAALDARLLAGAALGLSGLELALRESEPAPDAGLLRLEALAARRLAGEPVARILGEKEFYGLGFALNAATLVPRPETEMLVDLARQRLAGRAGARLLDLGTGSGAIAVAALHALPEAVAVATDLSAEALAAALANALRHGVTGRLALLEGDWFGALAPLAEARFDLILSNPPYVETGALAGLMPEVVGHDPRLALDGGPDGLAPYRVLAAGAARHLLPGGAVAVEIGARQGEAVAALFRAAGFGAVEQRKDLAGLDRVVVAHHL